MTLTVINLFISLCEAMIIIPFITKCCYKKQPRWKTIISIISIGVISFVCTRYAPQYISSLLVAVLYVLVAKVILRIKPSESFLGYLIVVVPIAITNVVGYYINQLIYSYTNSAQMVVNAGGLLMIVLPEFIMLAVFLFVEKQFIRLYLRITKNKKYVYFLVLAFNLIIWLQILGMNNGTDKVIYVIIGITMFLFNSIYSIKNLTTIEERDKYYEKYENMKFYLMLRRDDDIQALPSALYYLENKQYTEVETRLRALATKHSEDQFDILVANDLNDDPIYFAGFYDVFFKRIRISFDSQIPVNHADVDVDDLQDIFRNISTELLDNNIESLSVKTLDAYDEVISFIQATFESVAKELYIVEAKKIITNSNGHISMGVKSNKLNLKIALPKKEELI